MGLDYYYALRFMTLLTPFRFCMCSNRGVGGAQSFRVNNPQIRVCHVDDVSFLLPFLGFQNKGANNILHGFQL